MSLQPYTSYLRTSSGEPAVDALVTVRTLAGTAVPLYADAEGSATLPNPVPTDEQGRFEFFVAGGNYQVTAVLDADELPPFKISLPKTSYVDTSNLFGNMISPSEFGGPTDGTSPASASIQAAIDAIASGSRSGFVWLDRPYAIDQEIIYKTA